MKKTHLDKKKKMIIKITHTVCGKPQRRDKKPQFKQECNILARLSSYYVTEKEQFTIKLPFFPTNSPLSSPKISGWVFALEVELHIPFIV